MWDELVSALNPPLKRAEFKTYETGFIFLAILKRRKTVRLVFKTEPPQKKVFKIEGGENSGEKKGAGLEWRVKTGRKSGRRSRARD